MTGSFESPDNNPNQQPTKLAVFAGKAALVRSDILGTPGQDPRATMADLGTANALIALAQRIRFS